MICVCVVIQILTDWSCASLKTRDLKIWRPKAQTLICEDLWVWKISSILTWDGLPSKCGTWVIGCWCHPRNKNQYRVTKTTSPKKRVTALISTWDILCTDAACHISAVSPIKNLDSSISLFIQHSCPWPSIYAELVSYLGQSQLGLVRQQYHPGCCPGFHWS